MARMRRSLYILAARRSCPHASPTTKKRSGKMPAMSAGSNPDRTLKAVLSGGLRVGFASASAGKVDHNAESGPADWSPKSPFEKPF